MAVCVLAGFAGFARAGVAKTPPKKQPGNTATAKKNRPPPSPVPDASSESSGKKKPPPPSPSPVAESTEPAPAAVAAFDTAATITDPEWFMAAYRDGFRLYVIHATNWGTCTPWPQTQPQLRMALAAGLKIAAYTRDPRCWQGGIDAVGPYLPQLQFFALDIETDPGIAVTQAMVDGVTASGARPVIYTGASMWEQVMGGNIAKFASVPLWDTDATYNFAFSDWTPNLTFSPHPVAYGGWNTAERPRVIVQQGFEVQFQGVAVDVNSVDPSFLISLHGGV